MDEHLDEAEYACEELEVQLQHATLTLTRVEADIEARLDAHLDGLVVGGERVAERVLRGALDDDEAEPARITAAALALMRGPRPKLTGEALLHPEERVRRAALRGIVLADPAPLEGWASDRFREHSEPHLRASLLPIIASRLDPALMRQCLLSEDASLAAASARVVALGQPGSFQTCMEDLLEHASPGVRHAAMRAGLAWGSARAWSLLAKRAASGDVQHAQCWPLYAALCSTQQHPRFVEYLKEDALRAPALFALGFSGNSSLVPVLLEHLKSDSASEAKLAAQAIALITGLDTQDDAYCKPIPEPREPTDLPAPEDDPEAQASLPAFEDDDLDADLVPIPEDAMPEPDAAAVQQYWAQNAARFSTSQRYVCGQPVSIESLLDALTSARMRVRHVLAEVLGVRTGGQCWLNTRDLASRQRVRLVALRALQVRSFVRHFGHA